MTRCRLLSHQANKNSRQFSLSCKKWKVFFNTDFQKTCKITKSNHKQPSVFFEFNEKFLKTIKVTKTDRK